MKTSKAFPNLLATVLLAVAPICTGETEKSQDFSYVWPVNLSELEDLCPGDLVSSAVFSTVSNNLGFSWKLHLYPKGRNGTWHETTLGAFLVYACGPMQEVSASFDLYVIGPDGQATNERLASGTTFFLSKPGSDSWGWSDFLESANPEVLKQKGLTDGVTLRIGVAVKIPIAAFDPEKAVEEELESWNIEQHEEIQDGLAAALFNDVVSQKENVGYFDFKVIVKKNNVTFHCHKAVLAKKVPLPQNAASENTTQAQDTDTTDETSDTTNETTTIEEPAENNQTEPSESDKNQVTDTKHSAASVKEVLHYIYMGKVSPDLSQNVEEVLDIAEMLKLQGLKDECYKDLVRHVNKDNAGHLLILADQYNLKILREVAQNLIIDHPEEVFENEEFVEEVDKKLLIEIVKLSGKRLRTNLC